jgi:hypothetical protein
MYSERASFGFKSRLSRGGGGVTLVLSTCLFLLVAQGCDLPSTDGLSADPRNVLLGFMSDWANQDVQGLQRSLCVTDQETLRRIEIHSQNLTSLNKNAVTPMSLEGLPTKDLVLRALGTPPSRARINTRLRIALMRAEPTRDQSGLTLAGWRMKAHGSGYQICLSKKARLSLISIEESLRELETKLKQHLNGKTIQVRQP